MTLDFLHRCIFSFLQEYGEYPGLPSLVDSTGEVQIFRGYENDMPRPSGTDYIIFTAITDEPLEYTLSDFQSTLENREDGTLTICPLWRYYFQVDCYGRAGAARIGHLRRIFNSHKAVEFFQQFRDKYGGIGITKTATGQTTTDPDGTSNYAHCWSADFPVTARIDTVLTQDWLDKLAIKIIGVQ